MPLQRAPGHKPQEQGHRVEVAVDLPQHPTSPKETWKFLAEVGVGSGSPPSPAEPGCKPPGQVVPSQRSLALHLHLSMPLLTGALLLPLPQGQHPNIPEAV